MNSMSICDRERKSVCMIVCVCGLECEEVKA